MRITIKLDAFDHAAESAFAVLWIDREGGRWSREGHDRVELPAWGRWESTFDGTLLCDPDTSAPLLMLHGLALQAATGAMSALKETQRGPAEYMPARGPNTTAAHDAGHWHIQCIDRETTVAEHELFSDEENVAPSVAFGFSAT